MNDKDPPVFGYTFGDFFGGSANAFDGAGPSLLNDTESQSLADFFSSTDPFQLPDTPSFPPSDTKGIPHDYNHWDSFIAPATVHRVTTTVPDHGFHQEQDFNQHMLTPTHVTPPTLFGNGQPPFSTGLSQSMHAPDPIPSAIPMVATHGGLINEQLARLIPNHSEQGSLDAQFAAEWAASSAQRAHENEFRMGLHRPSLKRPFVFGTDNSFNNPAGYSGPHPLESESQARQAMRDMRLSQTHKSTSSAVGEVGPKGNIGLPLAINMEHSDDERSEDMSDNEDDEGRLTKKRRKNTYRNGKDNPRKVSRNGKNRKANIVDHSRRKQSTGVSQKMQRENLSEEQKRSNHILSEQKRRNLIKRGFDDLHDLVPEIRNGGLSKSSVLMEAANFLEKLIQENNSFWHMTGGLPVKASG